MTLSFGFDLSLARLDAGCRRLRDRRARGFRVRRRLHLLRPLACPCLGSPLGGRCCADRSRDRRRRHRRLADRGRRESRRRRRRRPKSVGGVGRLLSCDPLRRNVYRNRGRVSFSPRASADARASRRRASSVDGPRQSCDRGPAFLSGDRHAPRVGRACFRCGWRMDLRFRTATGAAGQSSPGKGRPEEPLVFLGQILPPLGILVGVHLVWTGATEPGGAFQGGTILAAAWILVMVAGLEEAAVNRRSVAADLRSSADPLVPRDRRRRSCDRQSVSGLSGRVFESHSFLSSKRR